MFQSSPLIAEGRYVAQNIIMRNWKKFQSSPLIAEGRYLNDFKLDDTTESFNPRPSSLRGATTWMGAGWEMN